jgi:hypothetical protein
MTMQYQPDYPGINAIQLCIKLDFSMKWDAPTLDTASLHKYLGEWWQWKYRGKREIYGDTRRDSTFPEFFKYQYVRVSSTSVWNDLIKRHYLRMWIYWISRLVSGFGIPCQYHRSLVRSRKPFMFMAIYLRIVLGYANDCSGKTLREPVRWLLHAMSWFFFFTRWISTTTAIWCPQIFCLLNFWPDVEPMSFYWFISHGFQVFRAQYFAQGLSQLTRDFSRDSELVLGKPRRRLWNRTCCNSDLRSSRVSPKLKSALILRQDSEGNWPSTYRWRRCVISKGWFGHTRSHKRWSGLAFPSDSFPEMAVKFWNIPVISLVHLPFISDWLFHFSHSSWTVTSQHCVFLETSARSLSHLITLQITSFLQICQSFCPVTSLSKSKCHWVCIHVQYSEEWSKPTEGRKRTKRLGIDSLISW